MSDTLKLGQIIREPQEKDAVHMAVAPVEAVHELRPGQAVTVQDGKAYSTTGKGVGVVDPFLECKVQPGDKFWLFLYPGSITSLRHDWMHPSFPTADPAGRSFESKKWLEHWAIQNSIDYDELIKHAGYYIDDDSNYWSEGGRFEGISVPDEFWTHYEKVTGRALPEGHYGHFFSCSC